MFTYTGVLTRMRRVIGNDHMILVFLALIAGSLAGSAVTFFRELIILTQTMFFASNSDVSDNASESGGFGLGEKGKKLYPKFRRLPLC